MKEELETDPLEQSQWCAGRGNSFLYMDFCQSEDGGETRVTIAFDGKVNGIPTTYSLFDEVLPFDKVVSEVSRLLYGDTRTASPVIEEWRRNTGYLGRTPSPIQNIRNFMRSIEESHPGPPTKAA